MGFLYQTLQMFRHPVLYQTWLYNGLSKSQHVICALAEAFPQGRTRSMIWESINSISGIRSKVELKGILQYLQKQKRIKTKPDPRILGEISNQERRFFYYLLPHPKNAFNPPIPKEKMEKIIPRPRSDKAHHYNDDVAVPPTRRRTNFTGKWDSETLEHIGEKR